MGITEGVTDRKAIRLGPLALRILARRRRWLRWLAVAFACLTAISALSHAHRRAIRPAEMPTVIVRHVIPAGRPIGSDDVELGVRAGSPGPGPFGRLEDAVGLVAVRGLRAGDWVTPEVAVSPLRYYGVAARVPRGMRAINLVVPSAEIFGGELAPMSRVDLLAAFEVDQDRAATTLLTSGIILRVRGRETVPPGGGRLGVGVEAARPGTVVEVAVAVPETWEREVALAQAFGHISLAVHPLASEGPHPDASGAVTLRRYLSLPPASAATMLPPPRGWPEPPGGATPSGARPQGGRTGYPYAAAPPRRSGQPAGVGPTPRWTVEVIEGAERSVEQVPRADSPEESESPPPASPARTR